MASRQDGSVWKGLLAGAAGGAAATLMMDVFQKLALQGTRKGEDLAGTDHTYTQQQEGQLQSYENAHAQTVQTVAQAGDASVSGSEGRALAPVVHYAFGALCGAVYGAIAEVWPGVTAGYGTAFGSSLFVGASETVLPALGMIPAPSDTPPLLHAGGWAAHAVYGAGTEAVRRAVRQAL